MLSLMEVIIALRGVALFASVQGEGLRRLADAARQRPVAAGALVFDEGDAGDELFVVHSGRVEIAQRVGNGLNRLEVIGPGGYFGEVALVDEGPRAALARVLDGGLLLSLGRTDVREAVLDDPDIAFAMLAGLSRRLRDASERIRGLSGPDPRR